jgi:excisionase family DNA binding protein
MNQKILSPKEVAKALHLSEGVIRKYIKSGKIPAAKVNKRWKIQEKDLRNFSIEKKSKTLRNFAKQLQSLMSDLHKQIEQYRKTLREGEREIVELALKRGWIIADPDILFAPNSFYKAILIRVLKNGSNEDVDSIFTKEFSTEDLKALTNKWYTLDCFKKRKEIINQAVIAYIHGQYYLSIYTLVPQIEGIIGDNLSMDKKSGSSPSKKLKQFTKDIISEIEFTSFWESIIISDNLETITNDKYFPLYKWVNFLDFKDDGKLNRHAIVHGVSINFASKANSLKLILFLDFLYQVLARMKLADKKA